VGFGAVAICVPATICPRHSNVRDSLSDAESVTLASRPKPRMAAKLTALPR